MDLKDRKSLLAYIKEVPEWQTALIWEQVAAIDKCAADLLCATGALARGFADSVLRPGRYANVDRFTRRDWNADLFQRAAITIGRALAALELLSVLADAFPRELDGVVMSSRDDYYKELSALCRKHGYTPEEVLQ